MDAIGEPSYEGTIVITISNIFWKNHYVSHQPRVKFTFNVIVSSYNVVKYSGPVSHKHRLNRGSVCDYSNLFEIILQFISSHRNYSCKNLTNCF